MVDALRAGLEVILDDVFNHTAEAGPEGPTPCFRGIDDLADYRIVASDSSAYATPLAAATRSTATIRSHCS
jgi:glycogen operon protein